MTLVDMVVVVLLSVIVGYAFGWYVVAPVLFGHLPFTSPRRVNEIERERGKR